MEPPDFEEAIQYLYLVNSNENDYRINFEEKDHLYFVKNQLFGNAEMTTHTTEFLLPVTSASKMLDEVFPSKFDQIASTTFNSAKFQIDRVDPNHRYFGCASVNDIKKVWNVATMAGTAMHETFEHLSNLRAYELMNKLPDRQLTNYYNTKYPTAEGYIFDIICEHLHINCGHCLFYRSEMRMFYDLLNIAGTTDTVLFDTTRNGYILTDFKRLGKGLDYPPKNPRKEVCDLAPSSRGSLLPFFRKQRNINSVRYGVQLAIYKRLFELNNPEKKVIGMIMIIVNATKISGPDPVEFVEVPLHLYDEGVDELLAHRASMILDHIIHDPKFDEKYGHVRDRLEELKNKMTPDNNEENVEEAPKKRLSAREKAQKLEEELKQEARRQKREEDEDDKWLDGG